MSHRDHTLEALRAAGEAGVSGERIAALEGVSRVAVAKHVASLREMGYVIDAAPGSGYRLVAVPDLALPWEVAPLVRAPLFGRFEGGVRTASTNDDARALAIADAPQGTVVVAARQTGGRGRFGRRWASPPGGAYVSVVLRPPIAPSEGGPLALVIALGIVRGLEGVGVCAGLKWPNDVRAGDGKLAGVLLEMSAEADRVEWVVAGFGLNVIRPGDPAPEAAYLRDLAPSVRVAQAAAAALDGIAATYTLWLAEGFEPLRADYEARLVITGEQVVVSDAAGSVRAHGTVCGVDAHGRLLVAGEEGTVAVSSGEVTLRPAGA